MHSLASRYPAASLGACDRYRSVKRSLLVWRTSCMSVISKLLSWSRTTMSQLVRLRSLFVPASIVLFLLFAAGWYTLFWLPSESRYLDDRNFRVLHMLSDQIRS